MRSLLHERLKSLTPSPLWWVLRSGYRGLVTWPSWRFGPRGRTSRARLQTFRNRHQGQRCFILGNGPSLNATDLGRLEGEITFSLNRGYLLAGRSGFAPTYVICVNKLVLEQFGAEISTLAAPKFLGWAGRHGVRFDSSMVFLRSHQVPCFATDPVEGLWEGATVTYVALQLAYFMGFATAILIGVDHRFATEGPANQIVRTADADPNHFDPAYFGRGVHWQLPDLETSEQAYRLARAAYERAGRRILNATIGGDLRVFERVAYASLFDATPSAIAPDSRV